MYPEWREHFSLLIPSMQLLLLQQQQQQQHESVAQTDYIPAQPQQQQQQFFLCVLLRDCNEHVANSRVDTVMGHAVLPLAASLLQDQRAHNIWLKLQPLLDTSATSSSTSSTGK